MSSSTLVMAIQHPVRSFEYHVHSDHSDHSDHGYEQYERLLPPLNATGFAPSHMSSYSSRISTPNLYLPPPDTNLRESQYQTLSINNLGYYSDTENSTITDKWTTGSNSLLHTESIAMTDNDRFRDESIDIYSTEGIPRNIGQTQPQNMHDFGPIRSPASSLPPSNVLRSHDQFIADLIEEHSQRADFRLLSTPSALIWGAQPSYSAESKDESKIASSSKVQLDSKTQSETKIRPKNHACSMCSKCFDRPSTLRKVRI